MMNELALENWLALAFVFCGVMAAVWIGGRVADSADPDKTRNAPPAE